jgi:hypothetical protein
LVERKPSKLDVAGSSPVSRLPNSVSVGAGVKQWATRRKGRDIARVAQSVEHTLGKGEVTGSIPVASLMARSCGTSSDTRSSNRLQHCDDGKSRDHTDESE